MPSDPEFLELKAKKKTLNTYMREFAAQLRAVKSAINGKANTKIQTEAFRLQDEPPQKLFEAVAKLADNFKQITDFSNEILQKQKAFAAKSAKK